MSPCLVFLLLVSGLFTVTAGDICNGYYTSSYEYRSLKICGISEYCCGTCSYRYCCSSRYLELSQDLCQSHQYPPDIVHVEYTGIVLSAVFSVAVLIVLIVLIICCCSPSCCIYKMCHNPRPVTGTQVAMVVNTQCNQQQQTVVPIPQISGYQPVPTQMGYAAQPVPTGQYLGQPYTAVAPPPYHMTVTPGYPNQAAYPMLAQPGVAQPPPETSTQPAFNPAYVQPNKTSY